MDMTRALLASLLLVSTGLAGCIGGIGDDEDPLPTDETEQTGLPDQAGFPLAFGYHGCVEQSGFFPFPMEAAAGFLPEGFEAAPFEMDPTGTMGVLGIITYSCDHAGGADIDVEGAAEMMGLLFVEPPEEFRADDIDLYAVHLGVLVSDESLLEAYEAWNIPEAVLGDLSAEINDAPMGAVGRASASEGGFTVNLLTEVVDQGNTQGAGKARAFGIVDGNVTNAVDYEWNEAPMYEGAAEYILDGGVPGDPFQALGMVGLPGFGLHAAGEDYFLELSYVPLVVEETTEVQGET